MVELAKEGFFDHYITRTGTKFKEYGVYAAVSNFAALLEYGGLGAGAPKPILRKCFDESKARAEKALHSEPGIQGERIGSSEPEEIQVDSPAVSLSTPSLTFISQALGLVSLTLGAALNRPKDKNVYPLVHVYLVFLRSLTIVEGAMEHIEKAIPWKSMSLFLDNLMSGYEAMKAEDLVPAYARLGSGKFPIPEEGTRGPLLEDYTIRGQLYSTTYHPANLFPDARIDNEKRAREQPWMNELRVERIVWLGRRLADVCSLPKLFEQY
jgi:hypothetical protein